MPRMIGVTRMLLCFQPRVWCFCNTKVYTLQLRWFICLLRYLVNCSPAGAEYYICSGHFCVPELYAKLPSTTPFSATIVHVDCTQPCRKLADVPYGSGTHNLAGTEGAEGTTVALGQVTYSLWFDPL